MKPSPRLGVLVLALAACAPAQTAPAPSAPTPAQAPPTAPAPPAPTVDASGLPPGNWWLLDPATEGFPGIAAERAYRELLAGRQPGRTVTLAIIDTGVDLNHEDLRANAWTNPREVAGNGQDDDHNGYVDDVHGWDFIGGRNGQNVNYDTQEVTRLYAACTRPGPNAVAAGDTLPRSARPSPAQCREIQAVFERTRAQNQEQLQQIRQIEAMVNQAVTLLRGALGTDSLTAERVRSLQSGRPDVNQARGIYLQLAALGATPAEVRSEREELESRSQYGYNPDFSPRGIVGDVYANPAERVYGNNDVTGPDAEHGTHVAGIADAVRGNGVGTDGVAPAGAVRIMSVRVVPNGDERDKDVANAIRYAVDNGANVINMSFGKGYSPLKSVVDEAVRYADSKGVLMVHASGNDGASLDTASNFPNPFYVNGGRAQNWIEVGASSYKPDSLAASFSNYSATRVDVFAPGVAIQSTLPGNRYGRNQGTSMASPVVAGLAAMLMAYYPRLTAADVRRIILASVTPYGTRTVLRPGSENDRVPFGQLSVTGGVVNAYNAIRMAEQQAGGR